MEELSDSETEPTAEENPIVDVEVPTLSEAAAAFSASITPFNVSTYTDKVQSGGRWAPAFPETSLERQEAYIERMIARDKELNLG